MQKGEDVSMLRYHVIKIYGIVQVYLHILLTTAVDVIGQLHAVAILPLG